MKEGFKSIKHKIMVMFISVVVFQIGIIAIFAIYHLKPNMTSIYTENQEKISKALFRQLSDDRKDMETYSVNIIGDMEIQEFLEKANKREGDVDAPLFTTALRNKILSYTNYDNRIKGIYLIDNHGQIYSNTVNPSITAALEETAVILSRHNSKLFWMNGKNDTDIIMCRVINNNVTELNRKIGIICMVIDQKMILESVSDFIGGEQEYYMLKSQDGYLLLGDVEEHANLTNRKDSFLHYRYEDEIWSLFMWIDKETIYSPVTAIFKIIFTEMILLLAVSVGFVIFLSGKLTKPLWEIRLAMKQVGKGNMDIEVPVSSNDEIGELALNMNKMSGKIKELVERIKEGEEKRYFLELKSMQYQINPHFLYNTLDSINMYARKNNAMEISKMVMSLSNFFRMSLSHGHEFIKIKEEVQYAVYYLDIQKIRFPDQLEWVIDLDDSIAETYMLKFLLQPLVENSINHGIRNRKERGCIWISVKQEEEKLLIEVSDNGMGMLPEELDSLKKSIEEKDQEANPLAGGFGLRNVNQRLKFYYGEGSGLRIESIWEEGTKIYFQIDHDIAGRKSFLGVL